MRKIIVFLIITMWTHPIVASNAVDMLPLSVDIQDKARLQRGAKLFMNYCSGCHSLRYLRYSRLATDLGLTTFDGSIDEDLLKSNLIFTTSKIHDPIQISIPPADARQWFGRLPPDLSLSARERGAEWIYTYLKSFYIDKMRPFGTNNLVIPEVGMPNILAPLQGEVIAVKKDHDAPYLLLIKQGEMSQPQFDSALQDLVTFLVYVGEPVKLVRYRLGIFVLIFLAVFLVIAYQLKKVYWRRIY
jgi:ubiquinol-cytochrome c reductase cytochrome c1 subunit